MPQSIATLNCAGLLSREVRFASLLRPSCVAPLIWRRLGARLLYLPPYSPDLNPIEQAFAFVKAWLRRHEVEGRNPAAIPWLIHQAMDSITPELAREWASNSGYL